MLKSFAFRDASTAFILGVCIALVVCRALGTWPLTITVLFAAAATLIACMFLTVQHVSLLLFEDGLENDLVLQVQLTAVALGQIFGAGAAVSPLDSQIDPNMPP